MSSYGALDVGEVHLYGKAPDVARALLDAAAQLGVDVGLVRTTETGFIVPDAVYDLAAPALGADDPADLPAPVMTEF